MTGRALARADTPAAADALCARGRPLAGATDLLVHGLDGVRGELVDLTAIHDPRPPVERLADGRVRVSATAPISAIARSPEPVPVALTDAIAQFASPQIRNRATLGGNIANGSPAADLVPPLVVTDAVLGVRGADGRRSVPVGEMLAGPGRTTLRPGEWIEYADLAPVPHSGFRKLGYRRALAVAVVSLAWSWSPGSPRSGTEPGGAVALHDVRLAAGAVAPTVVRCPRAEAALNTLDATCVDTAATAVHDDIAPIDDLRASAWYRADALAGLVRELAPAATRQLREGDTAQP
ncbi:carbon-monoxide dehydrogenase medium subunit/xanthine dehydrogenase small subunit [Haloactinopolyspora alba]|uniref:Carbon-monoxide dehydrogenase medium subunit/xanthine dehydrogenase small subunit n=1 Tax=Haloactinopolyspora alba TaxID=648780 RepID=A0A2P8DVN9_9ACTN|nr:FAD binding domain-containing protein [Haloactinopolyspora alba]PSL01279.1 carbon-monoxide dehydrogenase medium subunit/xanthine dehydrogenase small subunit [Haloactinopolyspora alba]